MAYADIVKESMDLGYYSVRDRYYEIWENSLFSVLEDAYSIFLPRITAGLSRMSLAYVGPGRQAACIREEWWREAARLVSEIDLYDIDERALLAGKQGFVALQGLASTTPIRTHPFDITEGLGDDCVRIIESAPNDRIVAELLHRMTADQSDLSNAGMTGPSGKGHDLAISEMVLGATGMALFERLHARLADPPSRLDRDDLLRLRAQFHGEVARRHLRWLADLIAADGACILATETSVSYGNGNIYPTFDQPLSAMLIEAGFCILRRLDGIWVDVPSGPGQHSHAVSVWHLAREDR